VIAKKRREKRGGKKTERGICSQLKGGICITPWDVALEEGGKKGSFLGVRRSFLKEPEERFPKREEVRVPKTNQPLRSGGVISKSGARKPEST